MIQPALQLFKEKNLPGIFALIPDDPLLTAWSSERIRKLLFEDQEESQLNTEMRNGTEVGVEDLLSLLKERPLFGKKRLLWITQSERSQGLLEQKSLSDLLTSPSNGSLTVVLEIPERKSASVANMMPVFRAGLPKLAKSKSKEILDWIHLMAGRKNLRLSPETAEILERGFSDQFGQISSFLDRIPPSENRGNRPVTPKDLEALGLSDPLESIFKIFESWEKRDRRVFNQWDGFVKSGQTPLGLLGIWHRQWRLYALAHFLSKGPNAKQSLTDQTRLQSFVVDKALAVGKMMSARTLRKGYALLRDADLQLKSGCDPDITLTRLFIGMWDLSPGKGGSGHPVRTMR